MSDIKIINIKNLKLDDNQYGGEESEEYKEEESEEEYKSESEEYKSEEEYQSDKSEELDPFIGGYDEMLFEDDNSDLITQNQDAGKKREIDTEVDSLIDELSGDPMLLVLTRMLVSKKGNNIADILEEIKDHLFFIRAKLTG
jgi:hypothetical protein